MGDFNLNLLNYESHSGTVVTDEFLSTLISSFFFNHIFYNPPELLTILQHWLTIFF